MAIDAIKSNHRVELKKQEEAGALQGGAGKQIEIGALLNGSQKTEESAEKENQGVIAMVKDLPKTKQIAGGHKAECNKINNDVKNMVQADLGLVKSGEQQTAKFIKDTQKNNVEMNKNYETNVKLNEEIKVAQSEIEALESEKSDGTGAGKESAFSLSMAEDTNPGEASNGLLGTGKKDAQSANDTSDIDDKIGQKQSEISSKSGMISANNSKSHSLKSSQDSYSAKIKSLVNTGVNSIKANNEKTSKAQESAQKKVEYGQYTQLGGNTVAGVGSTMVATGWGAPLGAWLVGGGTAISATGSVVSMSGNKSLGNTGEALKDGAGALTSATKTAGQLHQIKTPPPVKTVPPAATV